MGCTITPASQGVLLVAVCVLEVTDVKVRVVYVRVEVVALTVVVEVTVVAVVENRACVAVVCVVDVEEDVPGHPMLLASPPYGHSIIFCMLEPGLHCGSLGCRWQYA